MKYIIDTHVHTKEVSPCSGVPAADMIDLYIDKGFNGVIITDHYFKRYFESILEESSWSEKTDRFLSGYRRAKSRAAGRNFDVFLSIELTFHDSNRDYIIYGIDETFLYSTPKLYDLTLSEFHKLAGKTGLFIVQAHPFRPMLEPPNPYLIDCIEVHNGNPRHFSDNALAEKFAKRYGLYKVSGSDFHQSEDAARGGIILDKRINSTAELIDIYLNGNQPSLLR